MTTLRDLLGTWENWSAHDTLTRALANVTLDNGREGIAQSLTETPVFDPLQALRHNVELVELLTAWQWQAVYAALLKGASWKEIATATRTTAEVARNNFAAVIEHHVDGREKDGSTYRLVV